MSLNLNQIMIAGRLTSDPELKTTQNGKEFCDFRIAVNRPSSPGAESSADFIPCRAWEKTARFISNYFRKGQAIFAQGRLNVSKYAAQDGQERVFYNVMVNNAQFVESKAREAVSSSELNNSTSDNNTEDYDLSFDDLPF